MHGLDRADVEPSRRLRSDQHLRVALELPAEHELLEVAAREVPRRRVRPGRFDVVPLHQRHARARAIRRSARNGPREAGGRAIRLEDGVPRDADRGREPGAESVLGDVCDAGGDRLARDRRARSARPSTRTVPADDARIPEIVSASSRWPFPATPTIATISPARTRSETWPSASPPRSPCADRPSTERATSSRCGAARSARAAVVDLAADHERSERARRRVRPVDRRHRLASTKHGHAICNRHHLVELVRDEDHRLAVGRHRAQRLEELLRLLRREHRGRLVHDQNPRLAVERLQDLDPLLLADGQLPDPRASDRRRARSGRRDPRRRSRSFRDGRASTCPLPGGRQGRRSRPR